MQVRCKHSTLKDPALFKYYEYEARFCEPPIGGCYRITEGKIYTVYVISFAKWSRHTLVWPEEMDDEDDDTSVEWRHIWHADVDYLIWGDDDEPINVRAPMFEVVCPHLFGLKWEFRQYYSERIGSRAKLGPDFLFPEYPNAFESFEEQEDFFTSGSRTDLRLKFLQWKKQVDDSIMNAKCNCYNSNSNY